MSGSDAMATNMVEAQIEARGVLDATVLDAMRRVQRHRFVPEGETAGAYRDAPLPIGCGQTISQPYIVAYMIEKLELNRNDTVLDIGTGSGYQAAVLAEICSQVVTIEIIEILYRRSKALLDSLGYANVQCVFGDGSAGLIERGPFDGIIAAAATPALRPELLEQLRNGAKLIYPQGDPHGYQELVLMEKEGAAIHRKSLIPVRFVPMTNRADRR